MVLQKEHVRRWRLGLTALYFPVCLSCLWSSNLCSSICPEFRKPTLHVQIHSIPQKSIYPVPKLTSQVCDPTSQVVHISEFSATNESCSTLEIWKNDSVRIHLVSHFQFLLNPLSRWTKTASVRKTRRLIFQCITNIKLNNSHDPNLPPLTAPTLTGTKNWPHAPRRAPRYTRYIKSWTEQKGDMWQNDDEIWLSYIVNSVLHARWR